MILFFIFDRFINYFEYNFIDDEFLNIHYDILHLIKNKEKIYDYLLYNKKYEIIYKNKNIYEYIKINYLDSCNIYNKNELNIYI